MSALPDYEHDDDGARHGALPSYESTDAGSSSGSNSLPPTFKIGSTYTPPLVAPSEVRAHLLLLGAFHSLKERVLAEPCPLDGNMREDVKWGIFLIRATVRLDLRGSMHCSPHFLKAIICPFQSSDMFLQTFGHMICWQGLRGARWLTPSSWRKHEGTAIVTVTLTETRPSPLS